MARASKSTDQDVIGTLEKIADEVLATTGIFHTGVEPFANAIRDAK
jgi:phosphatidylinositol 3,5-bisphosphate 5-phosphatase